MSTAFKRRLLIRKTIVLWLALMTLFSLGRLYFFINFFPEESANTSGFWDTVYVFFMSMRFDSSISAILLIPLFLIFILSFVPGCKNFIWERFIRIWSIFAFGVTLFLNQFHHYFYFYYKDRFNIYLWEFGKSWENVELTLASLVDELPLYQVFLELLFFLLIAWGVFHFCTFIVSKVERMPVFQNRWILFGWPFLFAVMLRGTLGLPLSVDLENGLISASDYLNLIHGNPAFNLYLSWKETVQNSDAFKKQIMAQTSKSQIIKSFKDFASQEHRRSFRERNNNLEMHYEVPLLADVWLQRRPRHIVLVFMESFSDWVLQIEDEGFNRRVAGNFLKIREQSIYFDRYFPTGAGTIDNIAKTVLGVEMPRTFNNAISFKEAYQSNADNLPQLMKSRGYRTRFFYGGSLAWHHLSYFLKKNGFQEVYGENHIENVPKKFFGVYDEDLFRFVHQNLKDADSPTFNFVMTLSNHPPYNVPDDFQLPEDFHLPSSFSGVIEDEDYYKKRFRGFAYSDQALGKFIQEAQKEEYFEDTLFLFTADHPITRRVHWDLLQKYRTKKIPLAIYAPFLLKKKPQMISTPGSHLDLIPTLISLLSTEPVQISSWGKSLLDPEANQELHSFEFDCAEKICIYRSKTYSMDQEQHFSRCESRICSAKKQYVAQMRKAAERSSLYHFFE
ncbi:MAG: sulfatase-like hydrolase/transferase [SAR324 cluster bacterium]|nr:sulfatase-like hydrolase/transferase [SAR324 cluster bacterium]